MDFEKNRSTLPRHWIKSWYTSQSRGTAALQEKFGGISVVSPLFPVHLACVAWWFSRLFMMRFFFIKMAMDLGVETKGWKNSTGPIISKIEQPVSVWPWVFQIPLNKYMSSQHQVFKLIHCKFYPTKIHKPNGLGFEVPYLPNLSAQLANITSIATFTLDDFFNTDSLPQSLMWPKDPNRKSPSHSSLCQKSGDGVWALVLFWETPWFLDTPCPPPRFPKKWTTR